MFFLHLFSDWTPFQAWTQFFSVGHICLQVQPQGIHQQGDFSSPPNIGFVQFLFLGFHESFLFAAAKFRNLEQKPTPFLLQVALVESVLAFSISRISEAARGCEEMRNQDLSINRFWHPWCGTARLLQYTRILFQPWCAAHLRLLARSTEAFSEVWPSLRFKPEINELPSGKLTKNYGKSPFFNGKIH